MTPTCSKGPPIYSSLWDGDSEPSSIGILSIIIERYVENIIIPFNHEHDWFQNCTEQSKTSAMEEALIQCRLDKVLHIHGNYDKGYISTWQSSQLFGQGVFQNESHCITEELYHFTVLSDSKLI